MWKEDYGRYCHTFESFKSMTNSFTIDIQALHKLESFSPFHIEVQYANNSYILSGPKIKNLPWRLPEVQIVITYLSSLLFF